MWSFYLTQGAQPGTLWETRGVRWEWGGRLERQMIHTHTHMYTIMADSCCCTADINTALETKLLLCCSVAKLCPTLCNLMDYRMSDSSVLHSLSEFAQILVHWGGDAVSSPTISPSDASFSFSLQSFLASASFPTSWLFTSGGQIIGASATVLPMNILSWFPLRLTNLISLNSKRLSRVFSSTTILNQFFSAQPSYTAQLSHSYMTSGKTIALSIKVFFGKLMSLLFNTLSRFVIGFFPRSKRLLISWLQSPSAVILEPKKRKSVTASTVSSSICHEVMRLDAVILVFWMLSFKLAFLPSTFTLIMSLFSSSSHSAIRVGSSAYLRLLIFLLAMLISAWDSSSLEFSMAWITTMVWSLS